MAVDLTADQAAALDYARRLAEAGIPVLVLHPHPRHQQHASKSDCQRDKPGCVKGYVLPPAWQNTTPNPQLLNAWRPGLALAMVCGHGRDVIDLDPRNYGDTPPKLDGHLDAHYGVVSTVNDGWHYHVAGLGVPVKHGVLPGVDIQAEGSFVFLPPTPGYDWVKPPSPVRPDDIPSPQLVELATRNGGGPEPTQPGDKPPVDRNGPIPAGNRDDELYRYACSLRARNADRGEAEALMRRRWQECEQPAGDEYPWETALVKLDQAWQHPPGTGGGSNQPPPRDPRLTDPNNPPSVNLLVTPEAVPAADIALSTAAFLSDQFWTARPMLAHIRQAAWARGRSAEAVLGVVLARVAACTTHILKLPPVVGSHCGLSFIVALTGPAGSGKSSSKTIATQLVARTEMLTEQCDDIPPGSGEGLIELLFDYKEDENGKKIKHQVRHNVFVYADEGEILATQARRNSTNTIIPIIRSVFTDATLGQANASAERKRIVRGGQYVYGVVLGIQPDKAGPLFEDVGGGTPQRFLWMPTNADVPPPGERPLWPGTLGWTPATYQGNPLNPGGFPFMTLAADVETELLRNDHQRQRHGTDQLDVHADLVRLKTAALLSVMDGRDDVSDDDWALAGQIMTVSNGTRARTMAAVDQQQVKANVAQGKARGDQQVIIDDRSDKAGLERAGRKTLAKLRRAAGQWINEGELTRACGKDADHRDAALDNHIESGLAEAEDYESRGQQTRRYRATKGALS